MFSVTSSAAAAVLVFFIICAHSLSTPTAAVLANCGGGLVDLTPLAQYGIIQGEARLTLITGGYTVPLYVALCSSMGPPQFLNLNPKLNVSSSINWKNSLGIPYANPIVSDNYLDSTNQWSYLPQGGGVILYAASSPVNSATCLGNINASAVVTFQCNTSATPPVITDAWTGDPRGCSFNITIASALPALCAIQPSPLHIPVCGVNGIDLSALSTISLNYSLYNNATKISYLYYLRICGQPPECYDSTFAFFSELCVLRTGGRVPLPATFRLVSSAQTATTKRWQQLTPAGVFPAQLQMTATDGDIGFAECIGASVRPVVITYSCDPNATTPYFNLTTTDYCSYNAYVYTDLLCTGQNAVPISPKDTGSSLSDGAEAGIIIAVIAIVFIIIFIILVGGYYYRRSSRGLSTPTVISPSSGAGAAIQLGGDFIRQRDYDEEQK